METWDYISTQPCVSLGNTGPVTFSQLDLPQSVEIIKRKGGTMFNSLHHHGGSAGWKCYRFNGSTKKWSSHEMKHWYNGDGLFSGGACMINMEKKLAKSLVPGNAVLNVSTAWNISDIIYSLDCCLLGKSLLQIMAFGFCSAPLRHQNRRHLGPFAGTKWVS